MSLFYILPNHQRSIKLDFCVIILFMSIKERLGFGGVVEERELGETVGQMEVFLYAKRLLL